VASVLRDRIIDGVVVDGGELPRLEDLLDEFGVSKPTLREALRILEAEGLITVRRGKLGGAVVHPPRAQHAAYTIGLILRTEQVALGDVALALQQLEPTCAALCAGRADRATEVVPALEAVQAEAVAAVDGPEDEFLAAASRFHTQLVASCGNATMILVAGALESIWMAHAEVLVREEGGRLPTMAERNRAISLHAKILDKIRNGDVEGVHRSTRQHLAQVQLFPLGKSDTPIRLTGLHGFPAPSTGWKA
jgi:GntR family transcriptional regulator, transcriptional repressor for pyruvate dehydrogenase complex